MDSGVCRDFRVLLVGEFQVASVAGVKGVPATAGVRGGCSAIFSRKAATKSVVSTFDGSKRKHTLAAHGTFALTSIGRNPVADAVLRKS
jgi:hypothetical protein